MDPKEAQKIKEEMAAKEYKLDVKPSLKPKHPAETEQPQAENAAQTEMPEWLKTLTVAEAVKLPEFKESLNEVMSKARRFRDDFMYNMNKTSLRNDVIQKLDDMDEWHIGAVTRIYLGCLNKSLDTGKYSARIRGFITRIGDVSLNLMIIKIKENKQA